MEALAVGFNPVKLFQNLSISIYCYYIILGSINKNKNKRYVSRRYNSTFLITPNIEKMRISGIN